MIRRPPTPPLFPYTTPFRSHMYGKRPYAIEDESRNNWVVAMVSLGEGWHHNHHAFPTSAKHGLARFQFDPSYAVIRALQALDRKSTRLNSSHANISYAVFCL